MTVSVNSIGSSKEKGEMVLKQQCGARKISILPQTLGYIGVKVKIITFGRTSGKVVSPLDISVSVKARGWKEC